MAGPALTMQALVSNATVEALRLRSANARDFAPSARQVCVATWEVQGTAQEVITDLQARLGAVVREAAHDPRELCPRRLQLEVADRGLLRIRLQRNEWSPRCTLIAQVTTVPDHEHGERACVSLYSDTTVWMWTKIAAVQTALAGFITPFLLHAAGMLHVRWFAAPIMALVVAARLAAIWAQLLREDQTFALAAISALLSPRALASGPAIHPFRRTSESTRTMTALP